MISRDDLVVVDLDNSLLQIILKQSRLSSIGGSSQARGSDRQCTLNEDQISGHACHMASSIHFFGSIDKFLEQREKANADPYKGDGGVDFLGTRIDIKGGNKRKSKNILDYNLIVPEPEYHKDFCYVSALTKKFQESTIASQGVLHVCLIGWASADMLKKQKFYEREKRMLMNRFLNPIKTMPAWAFENEKTLLGS